MRQFNFVILESTLVKIYFVLWNIQYADPKMAGLIKEGPAIFGSAYCTVPETVLFLKNRDKTLVLISSPIELQSSKPIKLYYVNISCLTAFVW